MYLRDMQAALEEFIFVGQAHKIGIFDQLYARADSADGLAVRLGFDRRCTGVLLEGLVEMGYLGRDGACYTVPSDVYNRLIDKKGAEYEGDFWQFLLYLMDPWRTLHSVLKSGKPDTDSYKHFSMEDFIRGMDSPWKKRIAPEIVDICLSHKKDAKLAADIGGAPGTIAREFARRGVKTIIYDLPQSVDVMADELSRIENIELQRGDATKTLPAGLYDIAFLGNLCHGQSPEDNKKILALCHEHLHHSGIVVIFDNLRGESYLGARLALHMITQSPAGDIYTRAEYLGWLEQAGFIDVRVLALSDRAWHLIIAYKGTAA